MPLEVKLELVGFGLGSRVRRVKGETKAKVGKVLGIEVSAKGGTLVVVDWAPDNGIQGFNNTFEKPEDLEIAPRTFKVGEIIHKADYPLIPVGTVLIDLPSSDDNVERLVYRLILTGSGFRHYEVIGNRQTMTEGRMEDSREILWLPETLT